MRLGYHHRRVLGTLHYANGFIELDEFDTRYVSELIRRNFCEWSEFRGVRSYRVTQAGNRWYGQALTHQAQK